MIFFNQFFSLVTFFFNIFSMGVVCVCVCVCGMKKVHDKKPIEGDEKV